MNDRGDWVCGFAISLPCRGGADDGKRGVFEFDVPTGGAVHRVHSHHRYEKTIYGVRRTMVWTVDGVTPEVGPGEAVCVAHVLGSRHSTRPSAPL